MHDLHISAMHNASVSHAILCKSPFWEIITPLSCIQRPDSVCDWWAFLSARSGLFLCRVEWIYACLMLHSSCSVGLKALGVRMG